MENNNPKSKAALCTDLKEYFQEIFVYFDKNKSGQINLNELEEALNNGIFITEQFDNNAFEDIIKKHTGSRKSINFEEFYQILYEMNQQFIDMLNKENKRFILIQTLFKINSFLY